MVICLEQVADLHMAQLMPLPLTVSCFSGIQIGFTFLVLAHLGSPRQGPLNVNCLYDCLLVLSQYHMSKPLNFIYILLVGHKVPPWLGSPSDNAMCYALFLASLFSHNAAP